MNIAIGCYYNKTLFDPDYQTNVLDVAQTYGYPIPKYKVLQYQNRLMKDMKDVGFYEIQDTLANFAIGSFGYEQFRMIDWNRAGSIYTPYGGLIYSTNGVQGNGVNAYVDTNFNPAMTGVNYKLLDASRSVVLNRVDLEDNGIIDGVDPLVSSLNNSINLLNDNIKRINQGTRNFDRDIKLSDSGFICINRIDHHTVSLTDKETEEIGYVLYSLVTNSNQFLLRRSSSYSSVNINMYAMGAAIPFPMSQQFRAIYNQYLSNINLDPIA